MSFIFVFLNCEYLFFKGLEIMLLIRIQGWKAVSFIRNNSKQ